MENNNGVPTVAGWHDDPEDPDYIRYSNGRSWTGQRVAKDRTLTLKNDNVYRPGGGVGKIPEKVEEVAPPAPVVYQPLTRRERRQLEGAGAPEIEQMSDMFESDFEFHSAPKTISYAPVTDEPKNASKAVHEGFDLSEMEPVEAEAPVASEVSFFDTDDEDWSANEAASVSMDKSPVDEEDESNDGDALPSLDFDGFSGGFTPVDKEDEGGESPSLPSLGESSSADSELPSLGTNEEDSDESPAEEEFFFGKDDDQPAEEEDDFASALVQRHSYEAPPVPRKDEAAKEESVKEDRPSAAPAPSPVFAQPLPSYIAPDEDEEEAVDVTVKSSESNDLIADESGDEDGDADFGFQSKLTRSFVGDKEPSPSVPEKKEAPAPKVEAAVAPAHVDESDKDEGEDESNAASGFGNKFKSLFGKGRSKEPVLDYEYAGDEDDDDEDAAVESPSAPVVAPVVKPVLESVKKPVEKPVKPVEAVAESVDDADEEPQLKAGLFSSRQAKEDAAVEVELIDRLKDLAARVASLQDEEKQTLARVEAAKAKEAELNQMILQAHEEHELLDQLAKARQKEIDGTHAAKEEDSFRDFIDSHTRPEKAHETVDPEPDHESENTVVLPVVSHREDDKKEDSDESSSSLPELKLN